MNRIDSVFEELKAKKQRAFIPFVTAGDPSLAMTKEFVLALDEVGSSIIEIGIPFSDPIADGEIIQNANVRALRDPINVDYILEMIGEVRGRVKAALVFLTYANMIYHYGIETFFKACQTKGIDGVIVPDMPKEELGEFENVARDYGVHMIRLVAPTSKERIQDIAKDAKGFLYLVSSMGVTGVRKEITTDIGEIVEAIREVTALPIALGFGISTKEQVGKLGNYTEGIIVGSALVKKIEAHGEDSICFIKEFAKEMLEALTN